MTPTIFKQKQDEDGPGSQAGTTPSDRSPEPARSRPEAPRREPEKPRANSLSVLAPGTTIQGNVTLEGELQLEGTIEGSLDTKGRVVIGARGLVDGDVQADEVVVAGKVKGSVTARNAVRFKKECHVTADVRSPAIEVEEGAVIDGRVDMSGSGSSSSAGRPEAARATA